LIAWKSENAETLFMILFVKLLKLRVIAASETTLAGNVNDEAYSASENVQFN